MPQHHHIVCVWPLDVGLDAPHGRHIMAVQCRMRKNCLNSLIAAWIMQLTLRERTPETGVEGRLLSILISQKQSAIHEPQYTLTSSAHTDAGPFLLPIQLHLTSLDHSVNSSSHSVNGDIAIQWEWSNFDPSQNPNRLTDYDKTLHN